jgi:hypothetical protein
MSNPEMKFEQHQGKDKRVAIVHQEHSSSKQWQWL